MHETVGIWLCRSAAYDRVSSSNADVYEPSDQGGAKREHVEGSVALNNSEGAVVGTCGIATHWNESELSVVWGALEGAMECGQQNQAQSNGGC